MGLGPCTLQLGHPSLLSLLHLSNHWAVPTTSTPDSQPLFPFESLQSPTGNPNPNPEPSILNRFLFPAPPPSYGWDSFPGELICIASRDGVIIPCTVRALLAPPYPESWCHSRHGINAEDTREHSKSSPRLPFFAWDEPSNHKPKTCTGDQIFPGMSSRLSSPPTSEDVEDEIPSSVLAIYCHANGEDIGVMYEAGHWLCDTLGVSSPRRPRRAFPPHSARIGPRPTFCEIRQIMRMADRFASCTHVRQRSDMRTQRARKICQTQRFAVCAPNPCVCELPFYRCNLKHSLAMHLPSQRSKTIAAGTPTQPQRAVVRRLISAPPTGARPRAGIPWLRYGSGQPARNICQPQH